VNKTLEQLATYRRVLIALPDGRNPMYYTYYLEIINELTKSGVKIYLVQTTKLSASNIIPWIIDQSFQTYSKYKYQSVKLNKRQLRKNSEVKEWNNYLDSEYLKMKDLRFTSSNHPSLGDSLYSEFATSVALSSNPEFSVSDMRRKIHMMIEKYLFSHEITGLAIEFAGPEAVIVLNGRFLTQAASKDVAIKSLIPVFFLEHGGQPGIKYHLESFQTQDRIEFQENFLGDLCRKPIPRELVDNLLDQYQHNSLLNPFIAKRLDEIPKGLSKLPIASIFTSSIDEEVACPNWSLDNVENLTKRTIELSKDLDNRGYRVIVVIHPNAMNKSWSDLALQINSFNQSGLEFVPPWSALSSYGIISDSNLVVTWRSTIGLEAISSGKNLLVISDCHYDRILLEEPSFLGPYGRYFPCTLNNQNAARDYLFYLRNHGYDLTQRINRLDKHFISFAFVLLPLGGIRRSLQRRLLPFYNFASRRYSPSDLQRILQFFGLSNSKILEKKLLGKRN
jgi:hypothetical protein